MHQQKFLKGADILANTGAAHAGCRDAGMLKTGPRSIVVGLSNMHARYVNKNVYMYTITRLTTVQQETHISAACVSVCLHVCVRAFARMYVFACAYAHQPDRLQLWQKQRSTRSPVLAVRGRQRRFVNSDTGNTRLANPRAKLRVVVSARWPRLRCTGRQRPACFLVRSRHDWHVCT